MVFRRQIGWCVAQAYRPAGARARAFARLSEPGVVLPIVFHSLPADQVRRVLEPLAHRGVRLDLTFDDGWRESAAVLPLLEEFDLTATFFIAPGETARGCTWTDSMIASGVKDVEWRSWYALPADERYAKCDAALAARPVPRRLLDEKEVRDLARHPRVCIGNHTWSHLSCTHRPADEVLAEVDRAQAALREWCGYDPTEFAYPFGRGTPALDAALRERGLRVHYTRPGFVSDATRGAARNMAREGVSAAENLARVLTAWPPIGVTK